MSKLRVGVVRGGPSSEYEVSLKSGASVLRQLPPAYQKDDILITRDGVWHYKGLPINPLNLKDKLDVVLLCLHGEFGEDGQVQRLLDSIGLPYNGSKSLGSALSMNKIHCKQHLKRANVRMPKHIVCQISDDPVKIAKEVFFNFAPPYIVKPVDRGSSIGLNFAKGVHELPQAINNALKYSDKVMIEEFIRGREATCGVVEKLRGHDLYALMPVEIRPPGGRSFDYDAKYSGESEEICPGRFTDEEKDEIQHVAKLVHEQLGLSHYSRSDFIVSPRAVYFLETNTLPGLTEQSLLPKELSAGGISYADFLSHLVNLALEKI